MRGQNLIPAFWNVLEVYEMFCRPICREKGISQTCLDILMCLDNNPGVCTARDIVKYRGIKPNMVSFYVEKLAQEGLLTCERIPEDGRKKRLVITGKAAPLLSTGRMIQEQFLSTILEGIDEETRRVSYEAMQSMFDRVRMLREQLERAGKKEEEK